MFSINPESFPGGIALWGALPPVYDTTQMEIERGVHVHARKIPRGPKERDESFAVVEVRTSGKVVSISEDAAVAYVAAAILGLPLKYIECSHCNSPHLDTENYALDAHRKHLCHSCGQLFEDTEYAIGNPIVLAKQLLDDSMIERPMKRVARRIDIDQRDPIFSGGIRLWGTHPAILWTAEREEEEGIHVHTYQAGEQDATVDQTYGAVSIDGIELDPRAVRSFMVQQQAPAVRQKLTQILCCACSKALVSDKAPRAVVPGNDHLCDCGRVTTTSEQVIANEIPTLFARLYESAKFVGLSKNTRLI